MKRKTRFMAAVVALSAVVSIPLAYSAGLWYGLPVVGGGTYCSGNVGTGTAPTTGIGTGGASVTCAVTVPAGPTTMTGNELIPADLNSQGAQTTYPAPGTNQSAVPQTGLEPLANVASGAYLLTNASAIVNTTVAVPNGITNVIINNTGTLTTLAFIMPVTPTDGQLIRFTANATITTVFVTAGQSTSATTAASVQTATKILGGLVVSGFLATPTQGAVLNGFTYLYNLSGNTWFRVN